MVSVMLISDESQREDKLVSESESDSEDSAEIPLNSDKQEDPVYLKPSEVLRTPTFYQIWIAFFSLCLTNGLMGNYSKTYGLTFINDDHFFAWVGILANIFNGAGRIVWGIVYDKLNFKRTYLIMAVIVGSVTACLPILPYLDAPIIVLKVLYGFLMVSLYGSFPGIYAIVAAAVSDAFGHKYYQANFGLLFSNAVCYCILIIVFTKVPAIYALLGYTGMFLVAAGIAALGIIISLLLPKRLTCQDSINKVICS